MAKWLVSGPFPVTGVEPGGFVDGNGIDNVELLVEAGILMPVGEPVVKVNKSTKVGKTTLIGADLIADGIFINPNKKDPLKRTLIRHDSLKLAEALYRLI